MSLRDIKKFIDPVVNKINLSIAKGKINKIVDTSDRQTVKVKVGKNEVREVELLGAFGFASNPPAGSTGVMVFANGDREAGYMVATKIPGSQRPQLAPGEAVQHNNNGDYIWIKENGDIEIKTTQEVEIKGATKVIINASDKIELKATTEITGNLSVTGDISATGQGNFGGDISAPNKTCS